MIFPWGKMALIPFLAAFGAMLVYRLSQTGGRAVNQACLLALVVEILAGIVGFTVIAKTWGKDAHWVLVGVMIAAAIRLLISGAGVAIIALFTNVHQSWFILFLGIYYGAFLVIDTWLAIWILRNSEMKEREQQLHGNMWDIIS